MTEQDSQVPHESRSIRPLITALGVGQICSWGTLFYAFPLIAEAMRVELGWSKTAIYGAGSLGLALAGIAAYPVGAAIDRGLGRRIMAGGSVLAGLFFLVWSQATTIMVFYIAVAAIGCLQAATLYDAAFAVIARRSGPENARAGITTLTLWGGFASTVFIPVIQMLIDMVGWRGALIGLALVNGVVCAGIYGFSIDPRRDRVRRLPEPGRAAPLAGRAAVAWAMRQPVFWALVVAFVSYAAAFSALIFHLYPLLIERGLSTSAVVTVMAVVGPAQVVGRIVIWLFAPGAPIRVVGSAIVILFPVTVAGLALAPPDIRVFCILAAIYGVANGMLTIVRGLAAPEMISRDAYGAINGALQAPVLFMQALAPLAAAYLWSATGSYDAVLLVIDICALSMCASFWTAAALSRRR